MSKKTKSKKSKPQVEEQIQEEVKEVKEVKKTVNEFNVVKIVQKQPKGYRLLLEDGRIVKVTKDKYTRGQKTVVL